MYEESRNTRIERVVQFLERFLEEGRWQDHEYRMISDQSDIKDAFPIRVKFEHRPTEDTLVFAVSSTDPFSKLGVKIGSEASENLDLEEHLWFRMIELDESEDPVSVLSSFSIRDITVLERSSEEQYHQEVEELFQRTGRLLRARQEFD